MNNNEFSALNKNAQKFIKEYPSSPYQKTKFRVNEESLEKEPAQKIEIPKSPTPPSFSQTPPQDTSAQSRGPLKDRFSLDPNTPHSWTFDEESYNALIVSLVAFINSGLAHGETKEFLKKEANDIIDNIFLEKEKMALEKRQKDVEQKRQEALKALEGYYEAVKGNSQTLKDADISFKDLESLFNNFNFSKKDESNPFSLLFSCIPPFRL